MFSSNNPIILGIAMVLAVITAVFIGNFYPKYGEILGMQMVFPLVVIFYIVILGGICLASKLFIRQGVRKKNQEKSSKTRLKK